MGAYMQSRWSSELAEQDQCTDRCWYNWLDKIQGGLVEIEAGRRCCSWRRWLLTSRLALVEPSLIFFNRIPYLEDCYPAFTNVHQSKAHAPGIYFKFELFSSFDKRQLAVPFPVYPRIHNGPGLCYKVESKKSMARGWTCSDTRQDFRHVMPLCPLSNDLSRVLLDNWYQTLLLARSYSIRIS